MLNEIDPNQLNQIVLTFKAKFTALERDIFKRFLVNEGGIIQPHMANIFKLLAN